MVKVTSLIVKAGSGLTFSFGVRAWTEIEIWCVKGMHRLKLVSCENNSGFKGLTLFLGGEVCSQFPLMYYYTYACMHADLLQVGAWPVWQTTQRCLVL